MRSRTELVTTTFIDSEEDETESDDSEEDWRPDSSNRNGKKRKSKKRKAITSANKPYSSSSKKRKRMEAAATLKIELESDDSSSVSGSALITPASYRNFSVTTASTTTTHNSLSSINVATKQTSNIFSNKIKSNLLKEDKPLSMKVVAEQSMPDKSGIFQLYLYRKDLDKDYRTNLQLCLWRRDGSSLLQKYIRVKTNNSEEFVFTSSSVYSSWDERRRKDFTTIAVKCMEENNRRVTILNVSDLHSLAEDVIRRKHQLITEKIEENEDNSINLQLEDSQEEDEDDGNSTDITSLNCSHSAKNFDGEENEEGRNEIYEESGNDSNNTNDEESNKNQ